MTTEHADDSPTGKLLEAIIKGVDEFHSAKAPGGPRRVKVRDGPKERPTLVVDPATTPEVEEIFELPRRNHGLKELCKPLNDRGITNRGKRWHKSGWFAYYFCGTLYREGAGTCTARYLNVPKVERFIVEQIKARILTDEAITELVTLVAEEIDAVAGEVAGQLQALEAELADVGSRVERLYEALETSALTLEARSPRILALRHRQD